MYRRKLAQSGHPACEAGVRVIKSIYHVDVLFAFHSFEKRKKNILRFFSVSLSREEIKARFN
jgi:hypothetical protein